MNIWILFALAVGLVHLAGLLALVGCALWAPEGYEDAGGFHLGRQPEPQSFAPERMAVDGTLKKVA